MRQHSYPCREVHVSRPRPASRPRWPARRGTAVPGRPRRAPTVIMGMGNPLLGDDGVGWALARRIAEHPALPQDVYVAWGGTDLLTTSTLLDDRLRVILIDAVEGEEPGIIVTLDPEDPALQDGAATAHTLSLVGTLRLLRMLSPGLDRVDVHILGVTVARLRPGADLSPALADRLPVLVEEVLARVT